jgi:hypothetical protein
VWNAFEEEVQAVLDTGIDMEEEIVAEYKLGANPGTEAAVDIDYPNNVTVQIINE